MDNFHSSHSVGFQCVFLPTSSGKVSFDFNPLQYFPAYILESKLVYFKMRSRSPVQNSGAAGSYLTSLHVTFDGQRSTTFSNFTNYNTVANTVIYNPFTINSTASLLLDMCPGVGNYANFPAVMDNSTTPASTVIAAYSMSTYNGIYYYGDTPPGSEVYVDLRNVTNLTFQLLDTPANSSGTILTSSLTTKPSVVRTMYIYLDFVIKQ